VLLIVQGSYNNFQLTLDVSGVGKRKATIIIRSMMQQAASNNNDKSTSRK
jgi:hypothetical protein